MQPPKTQNLRELSERKRDGQLEYDGTTLKVVLFPDIIEEYSLSYCICCSEGLSAQSDLFAGKHQVNDILPITPIVTRHQLFEKRFKCEHLNQVPYSH